MVIDNMSQQTEMSASLLRQRRNLIIVSLVISFILYSKVEISKIVIFSIEFLTPNPEALLNVLWLIWFYFLVRYYQYLMVEPAIGIKTEFFRKFETLCSNTMLNEFIDKYPERKLEISDFSIYQLRKKSFLNWELPIYIFHPAEGKKDEYASENINALLLMKSFIKSSWHVFLHTPRVTDYAFPFILAALTAFYGAYKLIIT